MDYTRFDPSETDFLFRVTLAVIILSILPVSIHFRGRANRGGSGSRDRERWPVFLTLRIAGFGFLLSIAAFVIRPEWLRAFALPLPVWLRGLGLAIDVACFPLIVATFRTLGSNITDSVGVRDNHTLVTGGPYRHVRHPLYFFGGLAWLGMALQAASALSFILAAIAIPILVARTRVEEEILAERFGEEYRNYKKRTGRFVPRLR